MSRTIVVLGMHRSGTSCLAGVLKHSGVHFGDVVNYAPFNKKGNQEHLGIRQLNDTLLHCNGGAWDNPKHVAAWTQAQAVEGERLVLHLSHTGQWGFKDPRTVFTLPFWKGLISAPAFVGTVRHPMAVAKSLAHRDQFGIDRGLDLWYKYNLEILAIHGAYRFPLVRFDVPPEEYISQVEAALTLYSLPSSGIEFFDQTLVHQRQDDTSLPQVVRELWEHLCKLCIKADCA